jgi:hypothetical protein
MKIKLCALINGSRRCGFLSKKAENETLICYMNICPCCTLELKTFLIKMRNIGKLLEKNRETRFTCLLKTPCIVLLLGLYEENNADSWLKKVDVVFLSN